MGGMQPLAQRFSQVPLGRGYSRGHGLSPSRIFVPGKASRSPYVVIIISKIKSTPPPGPLSPVRCVGLAVSAGGGGLWGQVA